MFVACILVDYFCLVEFKLIFESIVESFFENKQEDKTLFFFCFCCRPKDKV
jgi:hypothetical protein